MALKTFVKISTVNNLSDARYCAGMQVNLMGFNLEKDQSSYIDPAKYKEITEWISGVAFVAEFEHTHPDSILEIIKDYPSIEFIQINEKHQLQMLLNTSYKLILKQHIDHLDKLEDLLTLAPSLEEQEVVLLLEADRDEIAADEINILKKLTQSATVILGYGINPSDVEDIIQDTGISGIALKGGEEIKPGLKDFDDLAEILEKLEVEE
ncbi:phosphoribosylanthranilate isomerase [Penaeicola halotolerans]|uniref:phosphoribosylanthranilate isomerase n=1 Tax=Penaeicola halotolerans TaxID=2793196 RepID=UPI001CF8A820|nr:phosphoribosylanthranilate isomerase [Penaeicola halotolerans]